jgi:hypothetical protein
MPRMDRAKHLLVEALRGGVDQAEIRLYRAGKLPGLFGGRTGLNLELVRVAQEQGLLEIVRTEMRGKSPVEWVRVTPKGVDFVLQSESPVRALEELRAVLDINRDGLPQWIAELRDRVDEVNRHLADEVAGMRAKLDAMMRHVEEALKRAEHYGAPVPDGAVGSVPWAPDAIDYLGRRKQAGFEERCALPELFVHLKAKDEALTIRDFHSGLRRLHDRGLVRLMAPDGPDAASEPEYALLDGPCVYYFAAAA